MGWFGVKRGGSSLPPLGRRELHVLEVLWDAGELAAQDVHQRLTAAGIGLSTVQSTLERLHRKGLVGRSKVSRAYFYQAVHSRSEMISMLLGDIAAELAGGDTRCMVSGFARYLSLAKQQTGSRDE